MDPLAADLARMVGERHVLVGDAAAPATTDWTRRFVGSTPAVVRPGTVDEVARVLSWCSSRGVAVVPQGGNTGLVAGATPLEGEVVLSLTRLGGVGEVDRLASQVTAGAGATLAEVQGAARASGLRYGVDLAARDSATIGGTVATNAGGPHVLRHGMTRRQVMGIEAVRSDGTVMSHLAGLEKDNTGYDLAGSLCGSEGTLAVVTAVRLRLIPRRRRRAVAALGFGDAGEAVAAVAALRALDAVVAAELVWRPGVDLALRSGAAPRPFAELGEVVLVVECESDDDPVPPLARALAGMSGTTASAVATDPRGIEGLWALRERQPEVIARLGVPHKLDVTLPLARLAPFAGEVVEAVGELAPAARTWLFGHGGDGNLHVNVTGVAPDDDRVDGAVLELVAAHGGSISAEHGIGRAKRRWLGLARSDAELELFAAIRRAWDPAGILNPGVLVPPR